MNDNHCNKETNTLEKNMLEKQSKKRKQRAKGYGRCIILPTTKTVLLYPTCCEFCRQFFSPLTYFETFKKSIYQSRQAQSSDSLKPRFEQELAILKTRCERYINSPHKSTKDLANEFLNDWECIFRVLDHPQYPLMNNEAERALRHWVIIRKFTQGTRTPRGSKVVSILASIIHTCKLRGVKTIGYLKEVIINARNGETISAIPVKI